MSEAAGCGLLACGLWLFGRWVDAACRNAITLRRFSEGTLGICLAWIGLVMLIGTAPQR